MTVWAMTSLKQVRAMTSRGSHNDYQVMDCQRLEVSVVQWISISACHADDLGSIPSQEVILDVDNLINVESTTLFLLNQSVGKSLV